MPNDKTCPCLQCSIQRLIECFVAENPGTTPGNVLDDLANSLGLGIGRAFNTTQDQSLTSALIERAVRQVGYAVMQTTKGKLRFEPSDVREYTLDRAELH